MKARSMKSMDYDHDYSGSNSKAMKSLKRQLGGKPMKMKYRKKMVKASGKDY